MAAILDLEKILQAFQQEKVQYLLVGGMAAIGHGMNYVTDDLDICYARTPANLLALVKALKPAKPQLRTPDGELPFLFDEKTLKNGLNFTLSTLWGSVDLLGELESVGQYPDLLPKALDVSFYGITSKMISLNDLIQAKKIAGRTKDKLHLLELEALRDILKNQK